MACTTITADCSVIGYFIDKIMHGSNEYTHPVGASYTESITFTEFKYATVVDPICRPVTARDCQATIESIAINPLNPNNPADTKATLSITFKAADGNCHTIALGNMKRGTMSGDLRSFPFTKSIEFVLEGAVPNMTYT